MSARRTLTLKSETLDGELVRTETLGGREYLVAPVVAMVGDSVVWPVNGEGAEFVPAAVIGSTPAAWNGRPVVANHPPSTVVGTPEDIVKACGFVLNTTFGDNRLRPEAWLDVERCGELGGDSAEALRRLQAGERCEVSIGAYVDLDYTPGTAPDGTPYDLAWTAVIPEHLAILDAGVPGACSVEMGCGAPRVMQSADTVTQEGTAVKTTTAAAKPDAKTAKSSMLGRALARLRALFGPDGPSDNDVYRELWEELQETVPGFSFVADVFDDTSAVVYCVYPPGVYETQWWRRTFVRSGDEFTLNDDAQEVEPRTVYEALAPEPGEVVAGTEGSTYAAAQAQNRPQRVSAQQRSTTTARTSNDDGGTTAAGHGARAAQPAEPAEGAGDMTPCKAKELAAAVLASGMNAFTEDELVAMGETKLTALRDKLAPTQKVVDIVGAAPAAKSLSADEWFAAAPADVRAMHERHVREEAERREQLVALLAQRQRALTEDQLNAKTTEQLEELDAVLASPPDEEDDEADVDPPAKAAPAAAVQQLRRKRSFAGRGAAMLGDDPEHVEPPDAIAAWLKRDNARRGVSA